MQLCDTTYQSMQKQQDAVVQFTALRAALLRERETIQKRLQQINAALAGGSAPTPGRPPAPVPSPKPAAPHATAQRRRGRPPSHGNSLSIREAVSKVTAQKALGLSEIVQAVQAIGYNFTSKDPRNSVGAFLYGPHGKKIFKRVNGKFSQR